MQLRTVNDFLQLEDAMPITPKQCRAARALVNWSQPTLAEAAGNTKTTISSFERGARTPHASNLTAIQAALEAAGIFFIESDRSMGSGVRLRDPEKK